MLTSHSSRNYEDKYLVHIHFLCVFMTVLVCQLAILSLCLDFQTEIFLSVFPNTNVLPYCKDMWERGEAVWNEICHKFFKIDDTELFGGY